jgi:DNA-directed RNA polymerase specialized sigma24 family protein
MTLENSDGRSWGADALALRAGRSGKRRGWRTTPAQVLAKAVQLDSQAISSLYALYRGPLLSFLRLKGASGPVAEDVTQGFFVEALHNGRFAKLQPVGSFGAWLRSGALHQLFNERKRARATKRRLEAPQAAELRSEWEERRAPASDRLLDQRRTALLVDKAWARLRTEYQSRGRELLFDHLRRTLVRDPATTEGTESAVCQQLGMSGNHLAVCRHRLKNEEFPAALLAELNEKRSQEQSAGRLRCPAPMTVREELRALLDDL